MKYTLTFLFLLTFGVVHAQVIDTMILQNKYAVFFETGSFDLNEDSKLLLDTISLNIKETAYRIDLIGHTDKVGNEEANQRLSDNRVNSVKEYLIVKGALLEDIESKAVGEKQPQINTETEERENRRVNILLYSLEKRRVLSGEVLDPSTGLGLEAKIKVTGKTFLDSTYSNKEGLFEIAVPDKAIYKVETIANGYFYDRKYVKVSKIEPTEIKVKLPRMIVGESFDIVDFNFKGDMDILLPKSVPTLQILYDMLRGNTVCLEIKGHINRPNAPNVEIGSRDFKLSQDRANMVMQNMIYRGISKDRLSAKGYGNWEMLYPKNPSVQQMSDNRRVEIVVLDCKELTNKNIIQK